jgi:hypothetical protein
MSTESTHTVVDNESITEEQSGPVFTLFPKLPPELRNKIWKNACFVTRFIDLWYFPVGEKEFRDACIKESSKRLWVYKSHSQTPPIMYVFVVTSASHDLALAWHTLYLARAPRSSLLSLDVTLPHTQYRTDFPQIFCYGS